EEDIDREVKLMRARRGEGTLTVADLDKASAVQDKVVSLEMTYGVSITADHTKRAIGTDAMTPAPNGAEVTWSLDELSQLEKGLRQLPNQETWGNSKTIDVRRRDAVRDANGDRAKILDANGNDTGKCQV